MKEIKLNKRGLIRLSALWLLAISAVMTGCQKDYELDLPLAVTSNEIHLTSAAGSTHILVYADGKWSATLTAPVNWASINKLSGEGNNDIVFSYAANYGVSRKVGVVFRKGDLCDTVMLKQAAGVSNPAINFDDRTVTLLAAASDVTVDLTTTVRYNIDDLEVTVTYDSDSDSEIATRNTASWIHDITCTSEELSFKTDKNTGDLPRVGYITLSLTDADGEITSTMLTVTQTLEQPTLILAEEEATYQGYAATYNVPVTTNLKSYAKLIDVKVDYDVPVDQDNEWINSVELTKEGMTFCLSTNEGEPRTATIRLSFVDSDGNSVEASHKVTQSKNFTLFSFSEVRDMISGDSGEITIPDYATIEGFIVSDKESANVCISPQTAQFKFDYNENYKTSYFESTDGKYGFCLKYASTGDNQLPRYTKARIALQGLTLVKEAEPTRYTLKGVTADDFIEPSTADASALPTKYKTVEQLTDDDLYTWVSLSNVEILCKDGCFTNATDGYAIMTDEINPAGTRTAARWDCAPLLMSDMSGNTMYMLTNAMVPWRRDGQGVPQGSGTFNGVIVAEELVRYGDLGRYQMRAMTREDIALDGNPFSKTIVEWNWNDTLNDVVPETGEGEITLYGDARIALTTDFNALVHYNVKTSATEISTDTNANNTGKGVINNRGIYIYNKWWDFDNDEGRYFDVSFSTAGLTGTNLYIGFAWNHGQLSNTTLDSPSHWKLLYSVDNGATFTTFVPLVENRSLVWWTTTSQDSCPGYKDFAFSLPTSCFGQQKVIVRFQVADKVTDIKPATAAATYETNLGIGKGTLTNKETQIRFGTLTVRYN